MKTNKSFATPSAKPVDVEYRLKRLRSVLREAQMFLAAIEPSVDTDRHELLMTGLGAAISTAEAFSAPAKKARASAEQKAAKAAALEAAKAAKVAAREVTKAQKATAKVAAEKPVKASKAKSEAPPAANPANSAIERALAAAKARKAAKAAAEVA